MKSSVTVDIDIDGPYCGDCKWQVGNICDLFFDKSNSKLAFDKNGRRLRCEKCRVSEIKEEKSEDENISAQ